MSPLLIYLSVALSHLQTRPHPEVSASLGWNALERWRDLASVLPPRTPVPRSARGSLAFLYSLLDQPLPDEIEIHHSNVATLEGQLSGHARLRDLVIAVLDIIVATLRETEGAQELLTPMMVRDLRLFAAHVL